MTRARRSLALLVAAGAALALAGTAAAGKSFALVQADVAAHLAGSGDLRIDERLQYSFSGFFSGGYREIPLRAGEAVSNVSVLEGGRAYRPGGCTKLGCYSLPGTFGVAELGGRTRIVWHYAASNDVRTFEIRYTLRGLPVAYDDVVDVNLKVWGDQWAQSLGRLTATLDAPGKVLRAWGHPAYVPGDVRLAGHRAVLRALDVPAHQFVELRVLVPRSAFTSTIGMHVVPGNGRALVVAQELSDAASSRRDHDRIEHLKREPWLYLLAVLALGVIPAALVVGAVYRFFGREIRTGYDREYEQEPPTDTAPALVPTLLRQGGEAGSFEFTATLFDLIRRGFYTAKPVTTKRSTWGGIGMEELADLEISAGKDAGSVASWERSVCGVVDGVLDGGSERLSRFRDDITAERATMSTKFTSFKQNVAAEVERRGWLLALGRPALVIALIVFAAAAAGLFYVAYDGWRAAYPRWSDVVVLGLAIAAFLNAAIVGGALTQRRLWRRASREAALEAERWQAFRRYLTDFPRLQEAPPATIELWERYLVYGIAFGIADRVLEAAHIVMPEALAQASSIYWISPGGTLGSGASSISIGDLSAGFGSALAPPSSGSGGFGGGFSGGGGFGGGGGGGGAW